MARYGNGVGHGPGCGPGWGGPARGAGSAASRAPAFQQGNQRALGPHDMGRARRRQRLMDELFRLAFTAESEEVQLSAAVAWLDRFEGKPVARSVNVSPDALMALDDAALAAVVADLAGQSRDPSPAEDL